jgi:hypothetical protein
LDSFSSIGRVYGKASERVESVIQAQHRHYTYFTNQFWSILEDASLAFAFGGAISQGSVSLKP